KDDNLSAKFTRESLLNTAKSTKAGDEIQQGQQIQTFWRKSLDFIAKKSDNISTENRHTKQDTGRTKKMTRYEIARKAYENDEMEGSTFGQLDMHSFSTKCIVDAIERGWITAEFAVKLLDADIEDEDDMNRKRI